MVAKKAT